MKKIISIVLSSLIVATGLAACKSDEVIESSTSVSEDDTVATDESTTITTEESQVQTENNDMTEWIVPESTDITPELADLFSRAIDGLVGVGYTPKLYLGYLVSGGTIHCFLCESVVIVPDAVPYWSLVYVFEDTEGNATVTSMYVPQYSTSGDATVVKDNPAELMPGGWSACVEQDADIDALIQDGFPGTEEYNVSLYTPKMALATQVVAGTNYAVLCETQGEKKDNKFWTIVYIYQDLQGGRSLINIARLDIGSIYGPLVWNVSGEDYREVCKTYLEEYAPDDIETILYIDNPTVTMLPILPESYYVVTEGEGVAPYYSYTYQTTNDGLLGPIVIYVDFAGTIMGLGYRE